MKHRLQPEQISDAVLLEQRRRAVRKILVAGGGVVAGSKLAGGKWARPVVNTVSLPAHAQLTGVAFSLVDPVFLTYECGGNDVIVNIAGFINVQQAGIQVDLTLSWANDSGWPAPTMSSPRMLSVFTNADGSYSASPQNIGFNVFVVNVTASLPGFPGAGTAQDSINPNFSAGSVYYCLAED